MHVAEISAPQTQRAPHQPADQMGKSGTHTSVTSLPFSSRYSTRSATEWFTSLAHALGRDRSLARNPITIGEAAKWTVRESENAGPRREHWKPFPGTPGDRTGAKSENGHSGTPETDRAVRDDRDRKAA